MKVRKIQVKDTIYVLRAPKDIGLDPLDILQKGRILGIRTGIQTYKDVYGKELGRDGRGWNSVPVINASESIGANDILQAVNRTKNLIEAEEKIPGVKLHRLAYPKWNDLVIDREPVKIGDYDSERYFVRSKAYCANCHGEIPGTQTLEVNSNGKVAKAHPFVADDPCVGKYNGGKKLVHPYCDVTHVEHASKSEKTDVAISPSKLLVKILQGDEYSAEFARGAALMFMVMNEK